MYKGKFNQKGKTTDIEQLLAERAAAAEKEAKEAKKQAAMAAERDPDVISPRTAKASSGRDLPPKTVPAKPVSQKAPAAPGKPVSGKTASRSRRPACRPPAACRSGAPEEEKGSPHRRRNLLHPVFHVHPGVLYLHLFRYELALRLAGGF